MSASTTAPPAAIHEETHRRASTTVLVGLLVAAALLGLLLPDRTQAAGGMGGAGGMDGMAMTHYMALLGIRQPWNLLMFMAAPVVLAEILAITELVVLYGRAPRWVHTLSHWAGLLAGPVMLAILVHLTIHAVVPLTATGGWRGIADVVAVLSYLAGAIPMIGISLIEAGLLGRDAHHARKLHVLFVGVFLVVAHVAMIFGMIDPTVLGWSDPGATPATQHHMPDGSTMPGMDMPGMNH